MTWITLLQLVIASGRSLAEYISPKTDALSKEISAELTAALDKLQSVHDKAVTAEGLEELRTTKQW